MASFSRLRAAESIRVLVIDTDSMGGQLMASALKRCRDHFDVSGPAGSLEDAVQLAGSSKPHVAILSMELQNGSGNASLVLHKLRQIHPRTAIVVLLRSLDREIVRAVFPRWCARGHFAKRFLQSALKMYSSCTCRANLGGHQGDELSPRGPRSLPNLNGILTQRTPVADEEGEAGYPAGGRRLVESRHRGHAANHRTHGEQLPLSNFRQAWSVESGAIDSLRP